MSPGEDAITAWFAAQSKLNARDYPIGIGDDMAAFCAGGAEVLVTTDMLLEGVHFDLSGAGLAQVGYKAMAVSLSDCAAMATVPVGAVISVGLPESFAQQQLKEIWAGLDEAASRYNCPVIGGDITKYGSGGQLCICSTIFSRAGASQPIRRSKARPGDVICVTGTLGGSGQGRHLSFEPRVKEALDMAGFVNINAMMDISDGLSVDLPRLCRASGVGATIEEKAIPVSQAAGRGHDPLGSALNDGEDFELLFTLEPSQWQKLCRLWDRNLPITEIGLITAGDELILKKADGTEGKLHAGGWEHLK